MFTATKFPLVTRFLRIHFVTQNKIGISALKLLRQLGITYIVTRRMKSKFMQVMNERDYNRPTEGVIQLDDAYWSEEQRSCKRGCNTAEKNPLAAAVTTNEQDHPIAMRLTKVKGVYIKDISRWTEKHLVSDCYVTPDGLPTFRTIQDPGYGRETIVTGGDPCRIKLEAFAWINTIIGYARNSIHNSYNAIIEKQLPRYLAEVCFRFNRRFKLEEMIFRHGYIAMRTLPIQYQPLELA
jgi:hypothetical protein